MAAGLSTFYILCVDQSCALATCSQQPTGLPELKEEFPSYPIPSMYGIFTYIWLNFMVNVGKYTVHGCYGYKIDFLWGMSLMSFCDITLNLPKQVQQNQSMTS